MMILNVFLNKNILFTSKKGKAVAFPFFLIGGKNEI